MKGSADICIHVYIKIHLKLNSSDMQSYTQWVLCVNACTAVPSNLKTM